LSIIGIIIIIIRSFYTDFDAGWPSLFVAVLFATGIILSMIGILGLYLGKIFEQVKQRPLFIISEELGGRTEK
jgi:dolichol-phosphate mannosyltransferase